MADPEDKSPLSTETDPFELVRIGELVRLMREHDLTEIDLQHQRSRIRLRRGGETPARPRAITSEVAPAGNEARIAQQAATPPGGAEKPEADLITITSPLVGTFYTRPNPEAESFVKVGGKVTPETVVCIVEAMKVFNDIPAKVTGTIVEVLVANQSPVEYGQPLFRVRP